MRAGAQTDAAVAADMADEERLLAEYHAEEAA
jgi:hypothetical protein